MAEAPRARGGPDPAGSLLKALRIEHAGSTSVPHLAAKPLIDIVLVVADTRDEPAYVPPLEATGYVLRIREPEWHEHRLFKGPDTNVNVHTFSDGCSEVDRMVAFRDWLRTHDDDRELYEERKARAGSARVEVRPELRGREVRRRAGDPRPSPERPVARPFTQMSDGFHPASRPAARSGCRPLGVARGDLLEHVGAHAEVAAERPILGGDEDEGA